jgi:hypothetical protein
MLRSLKIYLFFFEKKKNNPGGEEILQILWGKFEILELEVKNGKFVVSTQFINAFLLLINVQLIMASKLMILY